MAKPKQDGPRLMERIQVKGRDFDKDGEETPKDELLRMTGLFKRSRCRRNFGARAAACAMAPVRDRFAARTRRSPTSPRLPCAGPSLSGTVSRVPCAFRMPIGVLGIAVPILAMKPAASWSRVRQRPRSVPSRGTV